MAAASPARLDGFYMIESHAGHDCVVGDHVILTKQATLGGHCEIGDFVIVGGLAAVHQLPASVVTP